MHGRLRQGLCHQVDATFWRITRHVDAVAHLLEQFSGLERHVPPFDMLIEVGITRLDDGCDSAAQGNEDVASIPTQVKNLRREVCRKRICYYDPPLPRLW